MLAADSSSDVCTVCKFLCTNMHAGQTAKEAKKPLASFQGEKNRVLHYCVRLAMLPFAAAVTQLPLSCHQSQQETYMHHTSDNWWSPSSQLLAMQQHAYGR